MNIKKYLNLNPQYPLGDLLEILNKVRNDLFHGDKRLDRSRDIFIVKKAYPIIKKIVEENLNLVIADDNSNVENTSENQLLHELKANIVFVILNIQGVAIELGLTLIDYNFTLLRRTVLVL
jgi:hypothetical protein